MTQKYIFICGCPRSGTTALVRLLNAHQSVAIGMERYKYYANKNEISKINQNAFTPKMFFDLKDEQTNIKWHEFYADLADKYRSKPEYNGDKYPHYYRFYNEINENLGNVKWIFILRNIDSVAKSYNARAANPKDGWPKEADYKKAVVHWNESLIKTWKYQKHKPDSQLFVCEYERLFGYEMSYLNSLLSFLDLKLDSGTKTYFEAMKQEWSSKQESKIRSNNSLNELQRKYIQENAKHTLKENLLKNFSVQPVKI